MTGETDRISYSTEINSVGTSTRVETNREGFN